MGKKVHTINACQPEGGWVTNIKFLKLKTKAMLKRKLVLREARKLL